MMVNEIKNNAAPWLSTVPQQMPWMSSYQPPTSALHFGQPPMVVSGTIPQASQSSAIPALVQPQACQQPIPANNIYPSASLAGPTAAPSPPLISGNFALHGAINPVDPLIMQQLSILQQQQYQQTSTAPLNMVGPAVAQLSSPYQFTPSAAFNPGATLTQLPGQPSPAVSNTSHHKRSSLEMDYDPIELEAPPTKQLLSETKLFKRFGSLHLDGLEAKNRDSDDSEDSLEDLVSEQDKLSTDKDREEFNKYVYLLFKEKKNDNAPYMPSNKTLDRLAREERDKLSKAVVLWNPPPKHCFPDDIQEEDSDSDDDFKYSDHKDFLKKSSDQIPDNEEDSIIITEIDCDEPCNTVGDSPIVGQNDDIMLD